MPGFSFVIADDGEVPRQILKRILRQAGHELVGVAENGLEAVEMCREFRPDAVILDIIMPKLAGSEAANIILNEQTAKHIFIASLSLQDAIVDPLKARGVLVVSKPYNKPDRLLRVLASAGIT